MTVYKYFGCSRRRSGVCYFFAEGYSVFLPITALYLMAMGAMANRLKDANDAFQIRNEIGYICVATAITSGGASRANAWSRHRRELDFRA